MNQMNKVKTMIIAALLCAIGIMIPMYFPKFVLEPASFTLASHVPIFIAMFISPTVALSVAAITSFGFFVAGFPIVIVLRALTHVIFAGLGALLLKKNGTILQSMKGLTLFNFIISLIHAAAEVLVVTYFYWGNQMSDVFYQKGYLVSVVVLVGIGTVVHSMLDFTIATYVWKPLQQVLSIPASVKLKAK